MLADAAGETHIRASGSRRFGHYTIDVIGPSLGRLMLLPASTQGGRPEAARIRAIGREPVSFAKAEAIVEKIVKDHNRPLLALLRSADVIAHGGASFSIGAIRKALMFTQSQQGSVVQFRRVEKPRRARKAK
jgi:hypothetical protein